MTPTPTPAWQPDDLQAIRRTLSIPMQLQALEAITAAMAALLQIHLAAISSAQAELAAIALIDQQLAELSPEQLQAPIEVRRNAAIAGAIGAVGHRPLLPDGGTLQTPCSGAIWLGDLATRTSPGTLQPTEPSSRASRCWSSAASTARVASAHRAAFWSSASRSGKSARICSLLCPAA